MKTKVLSSLPQVLNFSAVIKKVSESYGSQEFECTKVTLERLISKTQNKMSDVIKLITEHVATLFNEALRVKIGDYYQEERLGTLNVRKKTNQNQNLIFLSYILVYTVCVSVYIF